MAENSTLTIRIAEDTKTELEAASVAAGQSMTDYIIMSVRRRMAAACPTCGRDGGATVMQPPGLGPAFTAWFEGLRGTRKIALATSEPYGLRVYVGKASPNGLRDSHVEMEINVDGAYFTAHVARAHIVMWAADAEAEGFARNLLWWAYAPAAPMMHGARAGRR